MGTTNLDTLELSGAMTAAGALSVSGSSTFPVIGNATITATAAPTTTDATAMALLYGKTVFLATTSSYTHALVLPAPPAAGTWIDIISLTTNAVAITATGGAGKMLTTVSDAEMIATTVTLSMADLGSGVHFVSTGSVWMCYPIGKPYTVAT